MSKATSVWDFLVDLVWNTSMVMIIFVDPERGEDSSIMQILTALARVTALSEVSDAEPTENMFVKVMLEQPNKSLLGMLASIQFARTWYEGNEERCSRAMTTQAMPWCFVHSLNYSVLGHKIVGGIKMNKTSSIWCGHVSLNIFDKRRDWGEANQVVISLVQVSNNAETGDWLETYSDHTKGTMEARTTCDPSAVADPIPNCSGQEMLSAVADDILKYGSRLLVGYWGTVWDHLPKLLMSCNAQLGTNRLCQFFNLGAEEGLVTFPMFTFILGPHNAVKFAQFNDSPHWDEYQQTLLKEVAPVRLDDEYRTNVVPDPSDFEETYGAQYTAHEAHAEIWLILVKANNASDALVNKVSSTVVDGQHSDWDSVQDIQWEYCSWQESLGINPRLVSWKGWKRHHRRAMQEMASSPFGAIKVKGIVSPSGQPSEIDSDAGHPHGLDTPGQRRAWNYVMPGTVSIWFQIGTARSGRQSRKGANDRQLLNQEKRAQHPNWELKKRIGPRRQNTYALSSWHPKPHGVRHHHPQQRAK